MGILSPKRRDPFGNKCLKISLRGIATSLSSLCMSKPSTPEGLTKVLHIGWMKELSSEKSSTMECKNSTGSKIKHIVLMQSIIMQKNNKEREDNFTVNQYSHLPNKDTGMLIEKK